MIAAKRSLITTLAVLVLAFAGCSEEPDASNQSTDQNPQVDQDPTPDTGTGGDQQGTVPAQPAQ